MPPSYKREKGFEMEVYGDGEVFWGTSGPVHHEPRAVPLLGGGRGRSPLETGEKKSKRWAVGKRRFNNKS